jgi:hypothetical protein
MSPTPRTGVASTMFFVGSSTTLSAYRAFDLEAENDRGIANGARYGRLSAHPDQFLLLSAWYNASMFALSVEGVCIVWIHLTLLQVLVRNQKGNADRPHYSGRRSVVLLLRVSWCCAHL